jgi:hypothetical protein
MNSKPIVAVTFGRPRKHQENQRKYTDLDGPVVSTNHQENPRKNRLIEILNAQNTINEAPT